MKCFVGEVAAPPPPTSNPFGIAAGVRQKLARAPARRNGMQLVRGQREGIFVGGCQALEPFWCC